MAFLVRNWFLDFKIDFFELLQLLVQLLLLLLKNRNLCGLLFGEELLVLEGVILLIGGIGNGQILQGLLSLQLLQNVLIIQFKLIDNLYLL